MFSKTPERKGEVQKEKKNPSLYWDDCLKNIDNAFY